jgi:hypothetical protein
MRAVLPTSSPPFSGVRFHVRPKSSRFTSVAALNAIRSSPNGEELAPSRSTCRTTDRVMLRTVGVAGDLPHTLRKRPRGRRTEDILRPDVSVVEKLVRPVLIYGFLVVALSLAGKREVAQLNSLDFIVLLAVANAVQNGIIGDDDSVTGGVLGASALFVFNGALAVVLFRRPKLRRLAEGTPRTLVSMGVVDHEALRKERLTEPRTS